MRLINYKFLNKEFLLIIIFAAILRLIFLIRDQSFWWDEAVYLAMADAFKGNFYFFEYFRPPLFPFLLTIFQATSLWLAKLFSLVVSVVNLIILYYLSRKVWDNEKALLISFLFAVNQFSLFYSAKALTESLASFLITLALFTFYFGFKEKGNTKFVILSGFLLGLAAMTKHMAAYLVFVFISFLIIKKTNFLKDKKIYLLAISVLIIMSPWLLFSYLEFGNPFWSQFSSIGMSTPEPVYFYLSTLPFFLGIQGFLIIFSVISIRKENFLLLNFVALIIGIIFLSMISHKELRFLDIILPSIVILEGIGLHNLLIRFKISFKTCLRILYIILALVLLYIFLSLPYQSESLLYECSDKIKALPNEPMSTTMSPYFSFMLKRPFNQLPWDKKEFSCENLQRNGNYTIYYSMGWYQPLEEYFINNTKNCTELLYNITNTTNDNKCLIYKIK
jgi:4-amino-4-deoxy-L-arabinose transferase-like glycosyltransferase